MRSTRYRLRAITREEHLAFVASRPSVSHLQVPSWGAVKEEWRAASLGWFEDDGTMAGAALVLLRAVPRTRRYLAYLPEGPVIDWTSPDLKSWLAPMLEYLRDLGAFSVKMGPPVPVRRWSAHTVKAALRDPETRRLHDVPPTEENPVAGEVAAQLRRLGWHQCDPDDGFSWGQPCRVFQVPFDGRSLKDVQQRFSQQWRRSVRKAGREGVQVVQGDLDDLHVFHELYVATAERERFVPRQLAYFQQMWIALRTEDPDRIRLYLALHEGETLSAALMLTVGEHARVAYDASAGHRREVQPDHALHWRMMSDAHALGATVYDLRTVPDDLGDGNQGGPQGAQGPQGGRRDRAGLADEEDEYGQEGQGGQEGQPASRIEQLRFRLGTGGEIVENLGEWDFALNKVLAKALDLYLARR